MERVRFTAEVGAVEDGEIGTGRHVHEWTCNGRLLSGVSGTQLSQFFILLVSLAALG
jgi:hypothetical protein